MRRAVRLPPEATIATRKLTDYLLRWRPEDDKSAFLEQVGYKLETADRLMTDIREQLLPLEAEFFEQSEYGPKYRIRGTLTGPNGKMARVISIWITEEATDQTKFVTLYPDKT